MGSNLKNKNVIYTSIFGDYNGLIPQPKIAGFDYVCFTDNPNLKATPWEVITIDKLPVKGDFTRSNRYYKLLSHLFFEAYDLSIYIDGNLLIIGDLNQMIQTYLGDKKMAVFSHKYTIPDGRNCIYDEYNGILELHKSGSFRDDEEVMFKQIEFFKSENYPKNNGLIKGGCLVRKHNDPEVIQLMEDWWYFVANWSCRDQLSFNYVAWKNGFQYSTISGDIRRGNPYIYWLGKHKKKWNIKLRKFYLKKYLEITKLPKA